MSLLLQLPLTQFKTLSLSSPFLNPSPLSSLKPKPKPKPIFSPSSSSSTSLLPIKAMKTLQGKVVCATSDKTVSVEVTRLAPHPKYKRRIRIKKKFQAHDPENVFQVGDLVLLEKTKPISKTKAFLAIPVPARNVRKPKEAQPLQIPLESHQS